MHIAFGIVNLFAGGGLQRDCARFAHLVRQQGHAVTLFAARREPGFAADLDVRVLPSAAWTNHGRNLAFARNFLAATRSGFDRRVGFDLLPGLDVLYCPHQSTAALLGRRPYLNLHPRYRAQLALERACFARGANCRILLLSTRQVAEFDAAWHTEAERIRLLPSTVSSDRRRPHLRTDGTRERMRDVLGLARSESAWLAVCAQPRTKGLDRTILVLPAFPAARLMVAGLGATDAKALPFVRQARRLGVADRISWLGFRDDVADLMAAADLLVHPARADTTGTVILEAIINGLPAITSAACGYAQHVAAAQAGAVVPEPFEQDLWMAELRRAEVDSVRAGWSAGGIAYGGREWLYEAPARVIESILAPPFTQR